MPPHQHHQLATTRSAVASVAPIPRATGFERRHSARTPNSESTSSGAKTKMLRPQPKSSPCRPSSVPKVKRSFP